MGEGDWLGEGSSDSSGGSSGGLVGNERIPDGGWQRQVGCRGYFVIGVGAGIVRCSRDIFSSRHRAEQNDSRPARQKMGKQIRNPKYEPLFSPPPPTRTVRLPYTIPYSVHLTTHHKVPTR